MVGNSLLLKMLHCKFHRNKLKPSYMTDSHNSDKETIVETVNVKTEFNEQDNMLSTCRVCLKYGDILIYEDKSKETLNALVLFADIVVNYEDKLPKALCQSCYALLQGAILFRKTAQQSDELLRQPNNEVPVYVEDSMHSDGYNSEYETEKCREQNEIYHCKKCNVGFDTFKSYSEHRLSQEHENMRHTCPICKNSYTTLYYKRHLALHKLEKPYMCDICGKNFIVQGQLSRHRVTHFYNLPFKCSLCPYKGRFSESLKMHMRSHTGEKPYPCTLCPSRFVNRSNLNKHMLTHKGDHDYKCDSCERGFYTKRDLNLHFKVDHSGIKDQICNVCGKAFGYRKQMMKHQLKVHKRQKQKSGRMPLYLQVETKTPNMAD